MNLGTVDSIKKSSDITRITRFGVSMEDALLQKFDVLIEAEGYATRSEAIRDLIRSKLNLTEISDPEAQAIGTLSLVYSHDSRDIADKLNDIQHHYFGSIVSATHVHLDRHNCLEVLILRGKAKDIKIIADRLRSLKNVRKGELTLSSAEE